MKRILVFIILFFCFAGFTYGATKGKCGENVLWKLNKSSGVLTISGIGDMYDYNYKKKSPWSESYDVKNVVIEEGVTRIGANTFRSCGGLATISIPKSVTHIDPEAFFSTYILSSFLVDANNPNFCDIDGVLFTKDKATLVRYPEGKRDGSYAIPEGVVTIEDYAFASTHYLSGITMPNSVTKIGHESFAFSAIKWIKLSNALQSIEKMAFWCCRSLTEITIPSSVTSVGESVFKECIKLQTLRYPRGLSVVSYGVPTEAYKMYNPESPETTIAISSNVVPSNPQKVKSDPQNANNEDLTWNVYAGTLTISGVGKMKDYSKGGAPWAKQASSIRTIKMDQTIFKIGAYAFYGCANVREIIIPNSVIEIGDYAFSGCKSLYKFSIPPSVKTIGSHALEGCDGLCEFMRPQGFSLVGMYIPQTCRNRYSYNPGNQTDKNYSYSGIVTPESLAQSKQSSNAISSLKNMPLLSLVEGSFALADPSNNNRIDAGENCTIQFKIANNGKGAALNCEARVQMSGSINGITVKTVKIPALAVGNTYEVKIPVTSSIDTQDGSVKIAIEVYEPNGFGIAPFTVNVDTKAYEAPYLQVVDYQIASASGKIKKMEPFTLSFYVQNTKYGNAEQVTVKVNLPANVFVMDGKQEQSFSLIKSGEAKPIQLSLVANNNYSTADIPITIDVKEKHGRFAENKQLDITLNQATSSSINIAAKDEPKQERKEIKLASIGSAVDKNIPISTTKNANTFVVIIANENYKQVAKVPYALNDGNVFKQYCEKTLGIPSQNIHLVSDATYMDIKGQVNWLTSVMDAYQGRASIIFYYAGHGVPDEASKSAFLLPIDGNGSDITTGYKLDNLYNALGSMPSERVTVFMDACFSGSKREEGMLASARGVAIKAKSGQPVGKMVVFSAATGDETAYPNNDEQHGMFTYYLLKKLQDTKGDVTLQDLGNYITTNVRQQSIVKNGKSQTPCVTPSAAIGSDWQNWKLK